MMYAGKQFGNDFRNGDDAVFGDSNRPRDDNGTKIRPGLQGDKWKFRSANKDTDFSMYQFCGFGQFTGIATLDPIPILFKTKWSDSEMASYGFDSRFVKVAQPTVINNPNYRIVPEKVEYNTTQNGIQSIDTNVLEIVEDGLYQIEITGQFLMANTYNVNNSYQYKFYVSAMQYNDSVGYRVQFDQTQSRGAGGSDTLKLVITQVIPAGARITAGYLHTWTSGNASIFGTIKAIKLG